MSSYKIAFYIELKNSIKSLQQSDLNLGNPGVGGTQYLFLLTVKNLNRMYGNKYALLLTDGDFGMEDADIPYHIVSDEAGALRYCTEESIGIITFNANILDRVSRNVFDTDIRILVWAHNTLTWKRQCIAAKTKCIDRIICVSKSQCDNMADTPCVEKCTYINNVIPEYFYQNSTLTDYSDLKVVYVGSVMPQKGVHNLIEIWKYVEDVEPKAQLYIFGGANVWNPDAKLGGNGAVDQYYDRIICKRLNKLAHPENIHFMGAKGWKDIDRMIATARVGVVNPSHYMRDETFCMSAVEMEAHGLPIISRQRNDGLNTTIIHGKTGFLEKDDENIAAKIVELLQNQQLCRHMGAAARKSSEAFVVQNEIYKWKEIVDDGTIESNVAFIKRKSLDGKLLDHDFILKLGFLFESRKMLDLIIKKIRGK